MKKGLLLILSITFCLGALAQQVKQCFPNGFRRATIPSTVKNSNIKIPFRSISIDNGEQFASQTVSQVTARKSSLLVDDEFLIGYSFYDLQTNSSISNRLCVNDDGTISAAWTFSPNSISGTTPPYPSRGSGYNYWNGTDWLYPAGPVARQEAIRTGFTNIVVTPVTELLITHSIVPNTDLSQIAVTRRTGKGSGPWTTSFPFGPANDTWPKAVAAGSTGSNNNVYLIFQGSGVATSTIAGRMDPFISADQPMAEFHGSRKKLLT